MPFNPVGNMIWSGGTYGQGTAGNFVAGNNALIDPELARIAAQASGQRSIQGDQLAFQGGQADANRRFQGDQAAAGRDFDWRTLLQNQGFQGGQADAQRAFEAGQAGATRDFTGNQNAADRDLQMRLLGQQQGFTGQQNDLNRQFEAGQGQATRDSQERQTGLANDTTRHGQDLQFQAAQLPFNWSREVFGQVFPIIQGLAGQLGGGAGGAFDANLSRVGGANTALPGLPASTVFDPRMVQQQINAGSARNQQSAATARDQATADNAARGFGSRSPLLAAMSNQIGLATAGANSDLDRETRMGAATANAQQGNTVAQLAQQQWEGVNNADIARRRLAGDLTTSGNNSVISLIAALAGLTGR
jgi:hypothetical protein